MYRLVKAKGRLQEKQAQITFGQPAAAVKCAMTMALCTET